MKHQARLTQEAPACRRGGSELGQLEERAAGSDTRGWLHKPC